MLKRLSLFLTFVMCIAVLSAQKVDRTVTRSVTEYFNEYTSDRCVTKFAGLDRRRNNIVFNNKAKEITIYCNEAFYAQPFTMDMVTRIYDDIRSLLPHKYKKYRISILYKDKSIEYAVPNIYRNKGIDKERLMRNTEYLGAPWVCNISRPFEIKRGLEGRHLALTQSHGRYYSHEDSIWKWQRPSLFCTVEDLFTQSIVIPFLIPMLENSGALVYTSRERDWQSQCVIVDNDTDKAISYTERNTRKGEWRSDSLGYAPLKNIYVDGENPFQMGTSRVADAVSENSRTKATVMWYPEIPENGDYAVYVAYKTYDNSVPDAHYIVMHAGGTTEYQVNQTMGGGTWVYLGTHTFKAGRGRQQGVLLNNASGYKGVVSADAVRFGGGIGNVARGESVSVTSGMPRFLEAARYNLQTSGFPVEVYSMSFGENDYRDDINGRSLAVNYLSGGSVYNPDTAGLCVPLELSFGFHTDAGYSAGDSIIGSVGVITTGYNGDTIESGQSRYISRDLVSFVLNNLQNDMRRSLGLSWPIRGIIDRNYSESRIPNVPSVIFEAFSHQNFKDLSYGFDPNFKFVIARSVYKSLLKHICYVHGDKYVVQPLPIKNFSATLNSEGSKVRLRWSSVKDPFEPTATPNGFVVYTKIGDGGYDNGFVVKEPRCELDLLKNKIYSFKVVAINDGGCSLPSEELSVYVSAKPSKRVLVVNGFHRMSSPHTVVTDEKVGFDMTVDPGVSYRRTPEFCGNQLDLFRENIGYEDGLGLSGSELEGKLIAGNTFDYPYVHGKALAENEMTFASCGSDAVMSGDVSLDDYDAVDLILGVEKQGGHGLGIGYDGHYKTFPLILQNKIRNYCKGGGSLFVSGAYIASDMYMDGRDRKFIREVLRLDYGGSVFDLSENVVFGSGLELPFERGVNANCYAVPSPDVLVPVDDAFVSFIYNGNRKSAGVAYSGDYRVLSTAIPFEAITDEVKRKKLMGAIMRFLFE